MVSERHAFAGFTADAIGQTHTGMMDVIANLMLHTFQAPCERLSVSLFKFLELKAKRNRMAR